jgi:hypothetical protein
VLEEARAYKYMAISVGASARVCGQGCVRVCARVSLPGRFISRAVAGYILRIRFAAAAAAAAAAVVARTRDLYLLKKERKKGEWKKSEASL